MVPRPVLAVLFLFPVTKKYQEYQESEHEKRKGTKQKISPNVYFTKQTIRNACGTVGVIHSLANNKEALNIDGMKLD